MHVHVCLHACEGGDYVIKYKKSLNGGYDMLSGRAHPS